MKTKEKTGKKEASSYPEPRHYSVVFVLLISLTTLANKLQLTDRAGYPLK